MASAGLAPAAVGGAAVAATAGIPVNPDTLEDKATQTAYTDSNGYAKFTIQLGPKSNTGIYDRD